MESLLHNREMKILSTEISNIRVYSCPGEIQCNRKFVSGSTMRIAFIILLVALAVPSLLVLSEYNHTLRRGLFYTAWKVAEVYERINPTELYRGKSSLFDFH
jgi:hypothetical protein